MLSTCFDVVVRPVELSGISPRILRRAAKAPLTQCRTWWQPHNTEAQWRGRVSEISSASSSSVLWADACTGMTWTSALNDMFTNARVSSQSGAKDARWSNAVAPRPQRSVAWCTSRSWWAPWPQVKMLAYLTFTCSACQRRERGVAIALPTTGKENIFEAKDKYYPFAPHASRSCREVLTRGKRVSPSHSHCFCLEQGTQCREFEACAQPHGFA